MSDHDHISDGPRPPSSLRWSWWDLAGITLHTVGTMLNELDNGLRLLAVHCGGAANYSRQRRDERDAEWAQERERQILAKALDEGAVTFDPKDLL